MHRRALSLALLALLVSLSAAPATAQKAVSASKAWIRLPAAGETKALAFGVIDNPTMYDVYFVSASAEIAESVQFRTPAPSGQSTLATEVSAPAYGALELKPDGLHLVLDGLKRPLEAGETVAITIGLETDAITMNAVVKAER
jgi:copper(I)-binding protein